MYLVNHFYFIDGMFTQSPMKGALKPVFGVKLQATLMCFSVEMGALPIVRNLALVNNARLYFARLTRFSGNRTDLDIHIGYFLNFVHFTFFNPNDTVRGRKHFMVMRCGDNGYTFFLR